MEKYRLQYFDRNRTVLAIQFAHLRNDYLPGDFYVRAITGRVDITKPPFKKFNYTPITTLGEARNFIQDFGQKTGEDSDCFGLLLEDQQRYVDFNQPIKFRDRASPVISAAKTIDATAIRRQTWQEDTYHILSMIYGDRKAKLKIDEYRLPQELVDQNSLEYKIKK